MKANNPLLSVIIVHYQVKDLLKECLQSIISLNPTFDFEILVADNHSPDASWKNIIPDFPTVQFFALTENLGFAKANNFLAQKAKGKYILLLNPDTLLVSEDIFSKLYLFAETKPNLGALGIQMFDAQNNFLPESKRSVPSMGNSFIKLFGFGKFLQSSTPYYREDIAKEEIAPVSVLTGAFLWVEKQKYIAVGGLDERYFMYGEDIDFCYSLEKMGYSNWYMGSIKILHYKGESTHKDFKYLSHFYGAMHLFVDKYYPHLPVHRACLKLGLCIRHGLAILGFTIKKMLK